MNRTLVIRWSVGVTAGIVAAFFVFNSYIRNKELHGGAPENPNVVDGNAPAAPTGEGERQRGDMVPTGLIGGGWTWVRTELAGGQIMNAQAGYVLSFDEDGRMSSTTDCNGYSGAYTKDDKKLTFGPMASTKMFCEGSMEGIYAAQLALAESYTIQDTELWIMLKEHGGTMVFNRESKRNDGKQVGSGSDAKNVMYLIDGENATLTDGVAETGGADGSKKTTRYFGNAVTADLNADGLDDTAFLLTQETGGSGTFFYVAVAIKTADGYRGTNAVLLGDRIAPQTTELSRVDGKISVIVNYADRKNGEPMTAKPTVGVSRYFEMRDGQLVETRVQ